MDKINETPVKVLSTKEVASKLHKFLTENKIDEAYDELFDEAAVNIEPAHAAGDGWPSVEGLDNIRKKTAEFGQMIEAVHGGYVGEPIVAGNFFALASAMDVTMKGRGRIYMEEITMYEVKNGKIVREQFFF
jgi:hypothetical protein